MKKEIQVGVHYRGHYDDAQPMVRASWCAIKLELIGGGSSVVARRRCVAARPPLSHQAGGGGVSMPTPPVAAAPYLTISLSSP